LDDNQKNSALHQRQGDYTAAMVKARWVDNKLVVEPVTAEEAAKLPAFVQETLDAGLGVAVADGITYSTDEATAREKLE